MRINSVSDNQDIANLLFEISSLRKVVRAHRPVLLTDDLSDNISSHIFLVTWISYILAKHSNADTEKALLMAMVHDIPESRTGDLGWINKRYNQAFEDEAIADIFHDGLGLNEFTELFEEYHQRTTLEAKIVKDADKIAQAISLKEYKFAYNNAQATEWIEGSTEEWFDTFHTEMGKKVIRAVIKTQVNDWAKGVGVEKRR